MLRPSVLVGAAFINTKNPHGATGQSDEFVGQNAVFRGERFALLLANFFKLPVRSDLTHTASILHRTTYSPAGIYKTRLIIFSTLLERAIRLRSWQANHALKKGGEATQLRGPHPSVTTCTQVSPQTCGRKRNQAFVRKTIAPGSVQRAFAVPIRAPLRRM